MCLTISADTREKVRELKRRPLIAKKDIIVYKVLRYFPEGFYQSIYKNFRYEKGFLYYQDEKEFSFERITKSINDKRITWFLNIHEGLHSFSTKVKAIQEANSSLYKVVKFIIPKGAKYYVGNNSDIVSNQLLFI